MAWLPISYTVPQYLNASVSPPQPASGFVLKAYQVGTTTNIPFATNNEGTTQENSIALNAQGYPEVSGNVVIPHMDQDYKLALYPSQTAANSDSGAVWTVDDIDLVQETDTTTAADYNVWPLVDYGGAYFDGTNDYLKRGAGLTGASNGKKGTLVAFVTFDNTASSIEYVLHNTGGKLLLRRDSDGVIRIIAENSAGSTILNMATSEAYESPDTVYCVMASWDLATPGSNQLYVNDSSDVATTTFTNDTIDYTVADWSVGADVSGSDKMTGNVLLLWFDQSDNLDFDTELNRRRFLDEQDTPVYLGVQGELPTGSQPILFLGNQDETTFETNRGSGGDFTENGALAASTVTFDGQYQYNRFPNVNADVTATDEELNKLVGAGNLIEGSLGGVVDATNGGSNDLTEIDFTGLPSDAKRITVLFDEVSFDTSDNILVQLGDSGGFETSGYSSASASLNHGASVLASTESSGFHIVVGSPQEITGRIVIDLFDSSTNTWVASSTTGDTSGGNMDVGAGRKSLSATLDRVRVTGDTAGQFDNGNINVLVESF